MCDKREKTGCENDKKKYIEKTANTIEHHEETRRKVVVVKK